MVQSSVWQVLASLQSRFPDNLTSKDYYDKVQVGLSRLVALFLIFFHIYIKKKLIKIFLLNYYLILNYCHKL